MPPPPPHSPTAVRVPTSTYRLQFHPAFTFTDALTLVPYLHRLGAGDLYASPLFAARPGSTHGYDVTDPTRLNPHLGSDDDFSALADALASNAMGLLLDIVPNHMAAHSGNPWWWDVLQNGPASRYASFFDIRWDDDPRGQERIVLPVLGAPLDQALKDGHLAFALDAPSPSRGVVLRYFEHAFPIDPAHYAMILLPHATDLAAALGQDSPASAALTRLLGLSGPLPSRLDPNPIRRAERDAGITQIRAALDDLLAADPAVRVFLSSALAAASKPDDPNTLSTIAAILDRQAYRLEYWKDGLRAINYRRFFDIADLASLQADRPEVFDAAHALARSLIDRGSVTGLRIDHIDGLADPLGYLRRLRDAVPPETYIVAEKILTRGEQLPDGWPVAGTTGYDFLNALSHVFVSPHGLESIQSHAARTIGLPPLFDDTAYEAKQFVISSLFPSEFASLAAHLARLPAAAAAGVPQHELQSALAAFTACLTVYRTYIRRGEEAPEFSTADRATIDTALQEAHRRDSAGARAYAVIRAALLPDESPDDDTLAFTRRWQQLSGPVMAKGVEDTALYRHINLASLNEVGGEPEIPPDPVRAFHNFCERASRDHPHAMLATSTHDTKRSEDARARLHVLSEIPDRWSAATDRWHAMNASCVRTLEDGRRAPSLSDELLIYQSLLAIWPLTASDAHGDKSVAERLIAAMTKSAREAKLQTSWSEPDAAYESALASFIHAILGGRPGLPFLPDFLALFREIAPAGALNALGQLTLKLAAPGVPDFYQGTELWDISLVDPDNRRPVDFDRRVQLLDQLESSTDTPQLLADLTTNWRDGRIKLHTTRRGLHARREHPDLFLHARYIPLAAAGPRADHIIAFARHHAPTGRWLIAVAPRLTLTLPRDPSTPFPLGSTPWAATTLPLPPASPTRWRNLLTDEPLTIPTPTLPLPTTLATLPTALLLST